MKKLFTFLLIIIAFTLPLVFYFQEAITKRVMHKVVSNNFNRNIMDNLPDGLHIVLCGAGSPLPDPSRAGPCTAIIAGEQLYIVDAGTGSPKNLALFRIPQGEIDGIFLTHFHSDHIDALGELLLQRWVNKFNDSPVPVYGAEGVEDVVNGINLAYKHDHEYRVAHHGSETIHPEGAGGIPVPFAIPENGMLEKILEKDGLTISTFAVDHSPVHPAVGYRFDYKGRSVVISGDTKKSANLQAMSNNVDVLIHEALNTEMVGIIEQAAREQNNQRMVKITQDIPDYHTSPVEAAEIARDAKVKHLLYTHIVPPLPFKPMEKLFLKGVSDVFEGGVTVGKDGTMISLEPNSKEVKVTFAASLI